MGKNLISGPILTRLARILALKFFWEFYLN